jgi:hypothetical protein
MMGWQSTRESLPFFLITVDTEGDNIWRVRDRRCVTTENARYIRRFQDLVERHGWRPTYLTNYEMVRDPTFCEFGREVLEAGTAEIGMHLHAWDTPPITPLTDDDVAYAPYLPEYPTDILDAKVDRMTALLEDTFQIKMRSHRGGRYGFDERYARALIRNGYTTDCSVTPGISWRSHTDGPGGAGGPDYTGFPDRPYFIDPNDISQPGSSDLLEVPVTTASFSNRVVDSAVALASSAVVVAIDRKHICRRGLRRLAPNDARLVPNGRNRRRMEKLLARTLDEGRGYAELTLHSSELMPGGSPWLMTGRDIERLYDDLAAIFEVAGTLFRGATLSEFRATFDRKGSPGIDVETVRGGLRA